MASLGFVISELSRSNIILSAFSYSSSFDGNSTGTIGSGSVSAEDSCPDELSLQTFKAYQNKFNKNR